MIKLFLSYACYALVGYTLGTLGVDYHNWQFYAIVGAMFANEIIEWHYTRKNTYEKCKKIMCEIIVEKLQ